MNIWRTLTRKHLYFEFSATKNTRVFIYERPGMWMTEADLALLLKDLQTVARKTLPEGALRYGVLGGDQERLRACIITLVRDRKTDAPIAFNVLSLIPLLLHGESIDLMHLGLVMVDPGARSKGLSWVLYGLTCFMVYLRGGLRPIWVSNVTQVPAIFGMVTTNFTGTFPGRPADRRTYEHTALARQIMTEHADVFGVGDDADFDEERFVIRNSYTGGSDDLKKTFEDCAKHRDPEFNDICGRELDYARGDDFLQIGQLSMASARTFIMKNVPKRSLTTLAASFAFMLVQSVILPFVHWLDASRPYKNLRPARSS